MTTAQTTITFMGEDFFLEADLTIHSFGTAPRCDDPGEDPDFSIDEIRLIEDRLTRHEVRVGDRTVGVWLPSKGPAFVATGALFKLLAASRALDDAILSALEHESARDDFFSYDD